MSPTRMVAGCGVVILVTALCLHLGIRAAHAQAVVILGDDPDYPSGMTNGHCQESLCGKLMGTVLNSLYRDCPPLNAGSGILFIGGNACRDPCLTDADCGCGGQGLRNTWARTALVGDDPSLSPMTERLGWNHTANAGPGLAIGIELADQTPPRLACEPDTINFCNTLTCIEGVDFDTCRLVVVSTTGTSPGTPGGLAQEQLDALNLRQQDILRFVNEEKGRLLVFTEVLMQNAYGFLPVPLDGELYQGNDEAERTRDAQGRIVLDLEFPDPARTTKDAPIGPPEGLARCCYHEYFTGPPGYGGLRVLLQYQDISIPDPVDPSRSIPAPLAVGGCGVRLGNNPPTLCEAGGPYVAECVDRAGTVVLAGGGSSDPDGDPLAYEWVTDCRGASFDPGPDSVVAEMEIDGPPPCPVSCTAILSVSDGSLYTSCDAEVRVEDTVAPALTPPAAPLSIECDCPWGLEATDFRIQAWLAEANAVDACQGALAPSHDAPAVFPSDVDPGRTTPVTFTATDQCGNADVGQSSVTIVTTTPPPVLRRYTGVTDLDPLTPPKDPTTWGGLNRVGACRPSEPRLQDPVYDHAPILGLPFSVCIENEGTLGVPGSPLVLYEGAGVNCPRDDVVLRAVRTNCSEPPDGRLDLEVHIQLE